MTEFPSERGEIPENFDELFNKFCEDGLDHRQANSLRDVLRRSPAARRLYVRAMTLHFWLQLRFRRNKDGLYASEFADSVVCPIDRMSRSNPIAINRYRLAIAALLLISLATWIWLSANSDEQAGTTSLGSSYAAVVVGTKDCVWQPGSSVERAGQIVREGDQLRLEAGLVELKFDSGAMLIAKGPVELDVVSPRSCALIRGELTAKVDRLASGFTVIAGSATVVDVGTEFGIRRPSANELQVEVFQGEVQVFDSEGRQGTIGEKLLGSITTGEVVEVVPDESGQSLLLAAADSPVDPFTRALPETSLRYVSATASLVAVDGFGRVKGGEPLTGADGGTGWRRPWDDKSTEITTTDVIAFADAATQGNPGTAAVHRPLLRTLGADSPVYASGRFRITGPDPVCTSWILLFEAAERVGGGEATLLAFGISDRKFSARLSPRDGDLAVDPNCKRLGDFGTYEDGATHLLVAKLEFNAVDDKERLSLWVDPTSRTEPKTCDHVVVYDTGKRQVDTVAIRFWEMDGETRGYIDDLLIGTTWDAVTQ